jgi:hypothetical protein
VNKGNEWDAIGSEKEVSLDEWQQAKINSKNWRKKPAYRRDLLYWSNV